MLGFAVCRRAALVTLACAGATSARADACPTVGAEPAVLASVAPRLELKLADGRRLRLAGLEAAAGDARTRRIATPRMPRPSPPSSPITRSP